MFSLRLHKSIHDRIRVIRIVQECAQLLKPRKFIPVIPFLTEKTWLKKGITGMKFLFILGSYRSIQDRIRALASNKNARK